MTEYQDMERCGFGFLPDGRVGVVSPTTIEAFDLKTGKAETISGPWKNPIQFRSFGGFSPDGSRFFYDQGGPYSLRLCNFDIKTETETIVRPQYLESFHSMVWVRAAMAKP